VKLPDCDFWQIKLLADEGLELARRSGRADYIGKFLTVFALILKELDDLPNVEQFYEKGLAEIRQLHTDPQDVAAYLQYYSFYLLHYGDLRQAQALAQESLQLSQQAGYEGWQLGCLDNLGMAAFKLGDVDKAEALFREALAAADNRIKSLCKSTSSATWRRWLRVRETTNARSGILSGVYRSASASSTQADWPLL
jgi:tetratricopeptide (TPR) repeat protein